MTVYTWALLTTVAIIIITNMARLFQSRRLQQGEHEGSDGSKQRETSSAPENDKPRREWNFRERLWHEPPDNEISYRSYQFYDAVSKKFKALGGSARDLEWKNTWLDLRMERNLLAEYRIWVGDQIGWGITDRRSGEMTLERLEEREFYKGLLGNLWTDIMEVGEEDWRNNEGHGKTRMDSRELKEVMDALERRGWKKGREKKVEIW